MTGRDVFYKPNFKNGAQISGVDIPMVSKKAIADTAYTVGTTDATIYRTYIYTSITAARAFTLCAASSVPAGTRITIEDSSGSVTGSYNNNTLIEIQIKPAGSDTVEGVAAATNFETIRDPLGSVTVESDGVSNWKITDVQPATRDELFIFTAISGWRKSLKAQTVRVIAIGAGGGGGAGQKSVVGAVGGGGGGGAAGGMTDVYLDPSNLAVTENVWVGSGSSSAGTRTSTGSGAAGLSGDDSKFSQGGSAYYVFAGGGGGGGGGAAGAGGAGGTAGVAGLAATNGGIGANANTSTAAGAPSNSNLLRPGSGAGGGCGTGAAAVSAGAGADGSVGLGPAGAGATGGPAGVNGSSGGSNGSAINAKMSTGGGGGGGAGARAGNVGANGFNGGDGGVYGGGGGGGSAGFGATGTNSNGDGGVGASGCVRVITHR